MAFVNVRVVNFCFHVIARGQFVNSSGPFLPASFFFITVVLDGNFATNVSISFSVIFALFSNTHFYVCESVYDF